MPSHPDGPLPPGLYLKTTRARPAGARTKRTPTLAEFHARIAARTAGS